MDLDTLLNLMAEKQASDLFITVGVPPALKVNGEVLSVGKTKLSEPAARELIESVMDEQQREEFNRHRELNFAVTSAAVVDARFRASAFYQRGEPGMVMRRIETDIPTVQELNLPRTLNELVMNKRGIIILVGATGTGKSTTLAAMVGHRNKNSHGHIISIEDPIEYIHAHQSCIITQREVGIDTESFEVALRNTLRQAPDVIVIGEIRTRETMEHAITFAETGHLVLTTLHANNANQALDRIQHFFPAERHSQLWLDLSLNLRAMIAQQLIPTVDRKGRRVAVEVLVNTPLASDLIRKGEVHELKELMSRSTEHGMQTFDQALYRLYDEGIISYDDALAAADSKNDLRLLIKLQSETDAARLDSAADDLSLTDERADSYNLINREKR
ncbi:MAG TPA: type IV pili twitching motility protein PilT [Porticoccaceae bacterium]|nr:type IV pili twitching motility protein PilT [Porticoccaceae bacterium]